MHLGPAMYKSHQYVLIVRKLYKKVVKELFFFL